MNGQPTLSSHSAPSPMLGVKRVSEESVIFSTSVCKNCDKFDFYADSFNNDRCPNNCVKWLCNCGSCPKDDAIREWINDFER